MSSKAIYYRRNLPHFQPDGYAFFVTFRLVETLPRDVLAELKQQRELDLKRLKSKSAEDRHKIDHKDFERYDHWLDRCEFGPRWLQDGNIAQIVAKEILNLNGERYRLMAYCLMPNHVHLMIDSLVTEPALHRGRSANYPVTDTLRLLKGRTARSCNLELNRSGRFWQHESYDRVGRDEKELQWTILYILNNPVKAGLVQTWRDWKFTYITPELGTW